MATERAPLHPGVSRLICPMVVALSAARLRNHGIWYSISAKTSHDGIPDFGSTLKTCWLIRPSSHIQRPTVSEPDQTNSMSPSRAMFSSAASTSLNTVPVSGPRRTSAYGSPVGHVPTAPFVKFLPFTKAASSDSGADSLASARASRTRARHKAVLESAIRRLMPIRSSMAPRTPQSAAAPGVGVGMLEVEEVPSRLTKIRGSACARTCSILRLLVGISTGSRPLRRSERDQGAQCLV